MNLEKVNKLIEAIERANKAALSIENNEDGGTCNFDTPIIKLDRWTEEELHHVKKQTDVSIGDKLSGYHKGYRFVFTEMEGQANRRTRMAEAAKKSLQNDGYDVSMYYQMD